MPTGALIVLIIVVWLFVLAPWLLRSQRPVNHTGEAFDDTRVLFAGDSGLVQGAKRPRLAKTDVHADVEELDGVAEYYSEDLELVDADFVDDDAAEGGARTTAKPGLASDTIDGEIVVDDAEAGATHDRPEADTYSDYAGEDAADDEDDADEGILINDLPEVGRSVSLGAVADEVETFTAPAVPSVAGDAAGESYPYDDSYTSPVDLMYPGAIDGAPEPEDAASAADFDTDTDGEAGADAVIDAAVAADSEPESGSADSDASPVAGAGDEQIAASPAGQDGEVDDDSELSAEEVEFAQRRLGRGGWDPVAEKTARATRYQRRQRTLIVLAVLVVASVALGIVVSGWAWAIAAAIGVVTVIYLVALRNQTLAEQQLHRRRVAQLRRARLGVRNAHDEELAIPRNLRRPGAVVLEADDESPDFAFLPVFDSNLDVPEGDESLIINRREQRDDLSARRVG